MDICKTIREHPIYKVRVWRSPEESTIYVFVGKDPAHEPLLQKLRYGKKELTAEETTLMEKAYGHNFRNKLAVGEDPTYVHETLYYDDNITTVKKKICMYVLEGKNDADAYMWIDREVKNTPSFRLGLAAQILKGNKYVDAREVVQIWHDYLGVRLSLDALPTRMDRNDVVELIKDAKVTSVKAPFGIRYVREKYLAFVPADPFGGDGGGFLRKNSVVNVDAEGSFSLESFKIRSNTIHVTTCEHVPDDTRELYFPNAGGACKQNKMPTNVQGVFQKSDLILHEVGTKMTVASDKGPKADCHVNYVHLRMNETTSNPTIGVKRMFDDMTTTPDVPFMKYNSSTVKYYKTDRHALSATGDYRIPPDDFDAWIETNPNDLKGKSSQEFVMFKVFMKNVSGNNKFASVIVFPDTHIDVKFNIKTNDDIGQESISHCFKAINRLLYRIRDHVGDAVFIPDVKEGYWNSHETFTDVKMVNMASTIVMTHPGVRMDRVKSLARSMFPFFIVNEFENEKPNALSLQYKRINNFVKVDNITSFLLQNRQLERPQLIGELAKAFNTTIEVAQQQYEHWTQTQNLEAVAVGNRYYFKPSNSSNATIKMDFDTIGIKVKVDGITDLKYHKRIVGLLKFLVMFSDPAQRKKLGSLRDATADVDLADRELFGSDTTSGDEDPDAMRMEDSDDPEDLLDTHDDIGNYSEYGDGEGDGDEGPIYDDEGPIYDDEEEDLDTAPSTSKLGAKDAKDAKDARNKNPLKNPKQYVINRLKIADPKLFKEKREGKKNNYSMQCQSSNKRQPIVITPDVKARIDKNPKYGPKSYDDNFIAYGSDAEKMKKNIYICPEVWCPVSGVSMTYAQFVKNGKKCPGNGEPEISLMDPYWEEKGKNKSKDGDRDGNSGKDDDDSSGDRETESTADKDDGGRKRKVRWVGFTGTSDECLPCCFNKKPQIDVKTNLPNKNLKKIETCMSPAGTQRPVKESVFVGDTNKYIVGPQFPLDVNRYGVLPPVLSHLFKNARCGDGKEGTGHIVAQTNCFVRRGIFHTKNASFLSCMDFLLDFRRGDDRRQADVVEYLAENMTVKMFVLFNKGDLCNMFVDKDRSVFDAREFARFKAAFLSHAYKDYVTDFKLNDLRDALKSMTACVRQHSGSSQFKHLLREYMIWNAYTNFMWYLNDPHIEKTHDVLWDIFNRETEAFNPSGLNVVLFEIEDDKAYVTCPYDDGQHTLNMTRPFVFCVKQSGTFEPVCRVSLGDGRTVRTEFGFVYGEDPIATEVVDFIKENCRTGKASFATGFSIYSYMNATGFKVRYQVIDYTYKLVGFIVSAKQTGDKVKMFVPCKPQMPILIPTKSLFIYVDDIVRNVGRFVREETARAVFGALYEYTKEDIYKIDKFISNNVVGSGASASASATIVKMADGTVVPLSSDRFPTTRYLHNLNIFVDWEEADPRTIYIEDEVYRDMMYVVLKNEIVRVVRRHKEKYYKDVDFLLSAENPFSLGFKRKKMATIIERLLKKLTIPTNERHIPIDRRACSGLNRRACDGSSICKWTAKGEDHSKCKIQVRRDVLDYYRDKLADAFVTHEQRVERGRGSGRLLANGMRGDASSVSFDQRDVIDGKVARLQKALANPYLFVNSMIDEYIKAILDAKVVRREPAVQTNKVLGDRWRQLSVEFCKLFNNRQPVKNEACQEDDYCINEQDENGRDFLYDVFRVVGGLKNERVKYTREIFGKIVLNRLIDDGKVEDHATLVSALKNGNGCIANFMKSTTTTLNQVAAFMATDAYMMSEYELAIMAEILDIKIYVMGRKTLRNPGEMKCFRTASNTKYFIVLFQKPMKTYDRYEVVAKNKANPRIVFNEDDLSPETHAPLIAYLNDNRRAVHIKA